MALFARGVSSKNSTQTSKSDSLLGTKSVEADSDKTTRSSGILLHPTSLPGRFGIGDFGPTAYAWIDQLVRARQKWWQILPLGPTGYGDSPYQCFSAFAGNPLLISPELLVKDGLLMPDDLSAGPFRQDRVIFGRVVDWKKGLLTRAWANFQAKRDRVLHDAVEEFSGQRAQWLEDFSLFMALKEAHGGVSWLQWPEPIRLREPAAINDARRELTEPAARHRFAQFLFFRQWGDLKRQANERGIQLIGDLPIFVSSDSADVWANPDLFYLDEHRQPTVVAGVPPDYFSATGQLWGNPLYNWEALKQTGYRWWLDRLVATLEQVDMVRLDHFRGFEAYWEVPASETTAINGQLGCGAGRRLFRRRRSTPRPAAVDRRGPGSDHATGRCLAAPVWHAGHAHLAVRLRRCHRSPLFAPQLRAAHRCLHGNSRQRLHARVAREYHRRRARLSPSLLSKHRCGPSLGFDTAGLVLGGRSGHRAAARRTRFGQRSAHELPRPALR